MSQIQGFFPCVFQSRTQRKMQERNAFAHLRALGLALEQNESRPKMANRLLAQGLRMFQSVSTTL
jgi:hypothetical protein